MRTSRFLGLALAAVALSLPLACKSSDGGAPQATPDSTSTTPGPATPTTATAGPTVGGVCSPGPDSIACAQGGVQEVTCAGGVWRTLQTCRGPGACKGVGSALKCDLGAPMLGDPCIPGPASSKCAASGKAVDSCQGGKWTETACAPPAACVVTGSTAACK